MRAHALWSLCCSILLAGCGGDDAAPSAAGGGGTAASSTGGPACTPAAETCDGADQDCDDVPDDGPCSAPAADGAWFLGGSGTDHVRGVAFDDAGNVYVTGAVTSPADFGQGPVDGAHGYVASLDPTGALRWTYLWGAMNSGYDLGQDVSVGGGVVCAGGGFSGTFDFGGGAHVGTGYDDAFVVCLDAATGAYAWDRAFGATLSEITEGVQVAASGDVVVAGSVESGTADFGGGPVGGAGAFVARYGPDGTYRWAHVFANSGTQFGAKPAVDAAGNVYVTGRFYDTTDFGGGPRTSAGGSFLAAFDADGNWLWDHAFEGGTLYGAAARAGGDVVISGEFTGTLSLGGEPMTSHGGSSMDAFAAAFDESGAFVWQYAAGGTGGTRGYGAAIGPGDTVVLAGTFGGTTAFGDIAETSAGEDDMFAVGLTPEGKYLWDVTFGGTAADAVNAVAVDPTGRIALGGETWGEMVVGSARHANVGGDDAALVFLH